MPNLKGVYSAALSSMPIVYIVVVLGYGAVYYLLPIASMLFLVGRELLMDIRDLRGDRLAGLVTLPMRLGETVTTRIAFGLEFSAAVLLIPLVLLAPSIRSALCLIAILATVAGAAFAWRVDRPWARRLTIYLLWLPLLAGIVILLRPPG
jgi:4-hydroxybenzoate polyprenyltransferase